ncbi:MAG: DUF1836 domain-containing protein [Clostridium sp.]
MNNIDKLSEYKMWAEGIISHTLPRWHELPEIDYYMDQVIEYMEQKLSFFVIDDASKLISPSIVNNYVKQKLIPSPNKKRYSRNHIAMLLIICILKPTMAIGDIQSLINSQLEKDDLETVYNRFCSNQEDISKDIFDKEPDFLTNLSDDSLSLLSMNMSIESNITKLLADKIVHILKITKENSDSQQ